MADIPPKTASPKTAPGTTQPGSSSPSHPLSGIPLPTHGFATLDDDPVHALTSVPAAEVITRAAVLLLSAAGDRLGMSADGEPDLDLDEARALITALAGLLAASGDHLGENGQSLRDGLRSVQHAFREASRYPDEPGQGPGERYLS